MTSQTQSTSACHKCDIIQEQIKELRGRNVSWRAISAIYHNIPGGSLQAWVSGKRDLKDEHKAKLGLPVRIPTVPCSACGKVHAFDRACEKQVTFKDKPKPKTYWRSLWDIPAKELLGMLENRQEMK